MEQSLPAGLFSGLEQATHSVRLLSVGSGALLRRWRRADSQITLVIAACLTRGPLVIDHRKSTTACAGDITTTFRITSL